MKQKFHVLRNRKNFCLFCATPFVYCFLSFVPTASLIRSDFLYVTLIQAGIALVTIPPYVYGMYGLMTGIYIHDMKKKEKSDGKL
jgi:hypothetical protein